jgi:hypothetical protein
VKAVRAAYSRNLLALARVGEARVKTGRHPIERLVSSCTDVAVRTHIPVLIDFQLVLIPIGGADQAMRAIARSVWPDDPSPMEEREYLAGAADGTNSGSSWREQVEGQRENAIEILMSNRPDAEARAEAFKALTGAELLVLVDEVSR